MVEDTLRSVLTRLRSDDRVKNRRVAFAESIDVVWQVFIGIAAIGLLACPLMKGLPLHTEVDRKWGLEENKPSDVELQTDPNAL